MSACAIFFPWLTVIWSDAACCVYWLYRHSGVCGFRKIQPRMRLVVETDKFGHVQVDAQQNTSVPGVYAVGDITPDKALTPVAVANGRRLADRLFGDQSDSRIDGEAIPSVVFSDPPLGSVGLSEEQARKQHGDAVTIYRSHFVPMQFMLVERKESSLMKLVCLGEDERVVGIHLLGPGTDEMLQGFSVALKLGLHKRDLEVAVAIHPTVAEELLAMG